jgi:hypothetical protein
MQRVLTVATIAAGSNALGINNQESRERVRLAAPSPPTCRLYAPTVAYIGGSAALFLAAVLTLTGIAKTFFWTFWTLVYLSIGGISIPPGTSHTESATAGLSVHRASSVC